MYFRSWKQLKSYFTSVILNKYYCFTQVRAGEVQKSSSKKKFMVVSKQQAWTNYISKPITVALVGMTALALIYLEGLTLLWQMYFDLLDSVEVHAWEM